MAAAAAAAGSAVASAKHKMGTAADCLGENNSNKNSS